MPYRSTLANTAASNDCRVLLLSVFAVSELSLNRHSCSFPKLGRGRSEDGQFRATSTFIRRIVPWKSMVYED